MYTHVYGNSKGFEVKVGMHQGSGLSPLLFVIVMEAISREFKVAVVIVLYVYQIQLSMPVGFLII